jgi:hypothetical protein
MATKQQVAGQMSRIMRPTALPFAMNKPGTNEDRRTLNPFIAWTYWPNLFTAEFYGLQKRTIKVPPFRLQ